MLFFFFCKQKTAYYMRISDWSSDVFSSDLTGTRVAGRPPHLAYNRPTHRTQSQAHLTNTAQVIKTRLPDPPPSADALLETVRAALAELKANDVVEIDVHGKTSVCDFMVVASGTSSRHVKAIADEVVRQAKKLDCQPLGVEEIGRAHV